MSRARSLCVLLSVAVVAACSDGTGPATVVTVTSVSPYNGPLAGGTAVTILGNFPATVDSVQIGTGRLGSLVRVTESVWGGPAFSRQLTGTTPPSATAGAVDVTVYTTGAGRATCSGCFTYRPPATWISLAAGNLHTCGLTSGGTAYCWGRSFDGQLGLGHFGYTSRTTPAAVVGGIAFASLTAGSDHTCGLTSGGAAYCWGLNSDGQLGLGDTLSRATPVAVAGGLAFASLTAGSDHTCGLTSVGAAYCWGAGYLGALGDGSSTSRNTPVAVVGGLTFASLTAGSDHTCGLTSGGTAYCWGFNHNGQLGLGDTLSRATPVAVRGGTAFTSLTAGYGSTCGLGSGGAAYCWGSNGSGQLGDGTTPVYSPDGRCLTDRSTPVAVAGGPTFASLTASSGYTCGLTRAGAAYCWGHNLGVPGTNSPAPVAVAGGIAFASLTAHHHLACGLTGGGAAYCWGSNNFGQLGDGSYTYRTTPVPVASP